MSNNKPQQQPKEGQEPPRSETGGVGKPQGVGSTESKVKKYFGAFSSSRRKMDRVPGMEKVTAQTDYKLASKLDAAGHGDLAKDITELSEKNPGLFSRLRASFAARSLSQRIAAMGGGFVMVVFLFGFIAFGLIWYRGMDIPILRNFSPQSHPVLAMEKDVETEYGVATDENAFRIKPEEGITFRSLGISNKIKIVPPVEISVRLSSDHTYLQVIPEENLLPDTEYSVTLREGTIFSDGTSLPEDYVWVFRTEPEFLVTGITPRDGSETAPFDTAIEVEFTYREVNIEVFSKYFEIVPPVNGRFEQHGKKIVFLPEDDLVRFSVYRVTVKKGFPSTRGETLPRDYESTFKISGNSSENVWLEKPQMYWSDNSPIISSTEDPWFGVSSYSVSGEIAFTLYKGSPEAIVDVMKDFKWELFELPDPDHITKIREFTKTPAAARFFNLGLSEYGIYFLEAYNASYGRSIYKIFVYSPIGLVLSDSLNSDRVWLSDMNRKEPLGGSKVYYYDFDTAEIPVHSTTTDSNGYATKDDGGSELIVADFSGNYAVALSGAYASIFNWWMGGWNPIDQSELAYRGYVYTDRPLYRPGDTVRFKTVLREEDDMSYGVPGGKSVTMRVGERYYSWDGYQKLSDYEETFITSRDYGTVTGEFVVPSDMPTGTNTLEAVVDDLIVGSASFTVAEYVKPRYVYEMSLDKTNAFTGDTVTIEVTGTDYSGDPAAGSQIGLTVRRGDVEYVNWLENEGDLDRQQMQYIGGESVVDTTLTMDTYGHATYQFSIDASSFPSTIGVYTASLWSRENYVNHDSETVVVAHSSTALFAKPDTWSVPENGENEIMFKTVNLWDFSPKGGVTIEYDVQRRWTEWVEDGDYYDPVTKTRKPLYRSVAQSEYVYEDVDVMTDDGGTAVDELVDLPRGTYYIYATYSNGGSVSRELSSLFSVYEDTGDGSPYPSWNYWEDKFDIYLDKETYDIGDTAVVTIKTPLTGNGIYMAKRGDVYDWRIIDLSAGVVTIQQEVEDSMAPWSDICVWGIDEFVSQEYSDGGVSEQYLSNIFKNSCTRLDVERDYGWLDVDVDPEQAVYEPGDTVVLDVSVSDSSGKGVEAEVSIDVVDRALLDIARESMYYSGGIHDGFYETVRQVAYQVGSPEYYSYMGWGGAGGGGGGQEPRTNFADVAYWDGKVRTNSSGRAQVEFKLPDNLTTWAVEAVAVTTDTWVGEGTAEFVARKDVRLDAKVPTYLRAGDEWEMDLEAYNYSDVPVSGRVSVGCDGCVDEAFSKDVQLATSTRSVIDVPIVPLAGVEEIVVTATLAAGAKTHDVVAWTVPVVPEGFIQSDTMSMLLKEGTGDGRMRFAMPAGTEPEASELNVAVARSFVNEWALVPVDPSTSSSIELSSSLIHNSLFLKYYSEIRPSQDRSVYEQKVTSALDLLSDNQAENGGYGWFDYDAVNFEVSAYVGIALGRASEVGMAPEDGSVTNLRLYLWEGIESNETSMEEKALGLYALAAMGDSTVLPKALYIKDHIDEYGSSDLFISFLMLALQELGGEADAVALVPYLEESATYTSRAAMWNTPDSSLSIMKSPEFKTATAYLALAPYETMEITVQARTWLLENPITVGGNSPDAVAAFYALTAPNIENLEGRIGVNKVTLKVNGQSVRTFDVGGDSDTISRVSVSVPSGYLRDGENVVEIERTGEGDLYVTSNLSYYSTNIGGTDEFEVTRMIRDFETGTPVVSVEKGDVVTIRTTVKADRNSYNMVVQDFLPAGFEPVQYQLGNYDYQFYNKWWKWGSDDYVNRYGSIAQDHITFDEYKVEEGKVYVFEFPAVATFTGEFSGAGAQGYLLGFGDIGGYVLSPTLKVTE